MATSNQFIGKLYVRVNGVLLPIQGDASVEVGGVEREPVVLNDGTVGYREVYKEANVECTIAHNGQVALKEIQAIKDATINVEADTGHRWVITGAFSTSIPKINQNGEIEAKFSGQEAEEIGAS